MKYRTSIKPVRVALLGIFYSVYHIIALVHVHAANAISGDKFNAAEIVCSEC